MKISTLLACFTLYSSFAINAHAWISLNHDWTIPGPGGRYGIQEIEKSGAAFPHGKYTLVCIGADKHHLPCSFSFAVSLVVLVGGTSILAGGVLVLGKQKGTEVKGA
jgi:hypothetical protein